MPYEGAGRPPVLFAHRVGDQLWVWCPACRKRHVHGAAGGDGHRLGHCTAYARTGYVLQEVRGVVLWVAA
jgi:hypothetical protein